MFRRFKFRRRLKKSGVLIECQYVVILNNVDPIYFNSKDELDKYVAEYRSHNSIFSLQIYRIETYTL